MLVSTQLFAAIIIAIVGGTIFWSNPHRVVNRFFLSFSLHLSAWLGCVYMAVSRGEDPAWIRMSSAVAAFVPLHMWMLKQTYLTTGPLQFGAKKKTILAWTLPAIVLAALCFTPWYVLPRSAAGGAPHFGLAYFAYMLGEFTLFGLLCRETVVQIRRIAGASRLELQILLLGVIAAAFAIILLMALRAALGAIWPIHLQPIMLLLVYTVTVVAVTTHRIFNARQIVIVVAQKIGLVAIAAVTAYVADHVLSLFGVPEPFPLLITVGATLWLVAVLNRRLQAMFEFYPEATAARRATFLAAQRETRIDALEAEFRNVIKGWGQTEYALVSAGVKGAVLSGGEGLACDGSLMRTLLQLRWATPERLGRERSTPEREELNEFMKSRGLALLVASEGATLVALIGAGASASRLPFTYPQVTQLTEIASIMVNALERVHFSTKAQHAEQLATVGLLGASVAHEIRNPLVTIKTFVQLLPAHYQDAAFREKFFRLIADEVNRIDRLTEQLLDLASPRAYTATNVELHTLLRATMDLVATKAAHRDVQLVTDLAAAPDIVYTDAAAAKQVMLNLCFNAIQALDGQEDGRRSVWIGTRNTPSGVEVAVTDSGPGIAPEILPRLFQPFQTTKSSGFGLGLAICSDILANLNASITVDPPVPGQGATFRVTFPCQPSLS